MSDPIGIVAPVVARLGPVAVTTTVVYSLLDSAVLVVGSALITHAVTLRMTPGQNVLELVVEWILDQIKAVTGAKDPKAFLPLIATLGLFILVGNVMGILPGLAAPTSDLSTTAALALVVFFAVPYYGIRDRGVAGYLRHYLEPTWVMLPFNVISEVARTLALAVRLFGNMMSGELVTAVLILIAGLLVPVPILALHLLIALVQAYIFAVLSLVYIGAVLRRRPESQEPKEAP